MAKTNLKKVWKILKQIKSENLLDDRREYDVEDFESAYQITKTEAKFLFAQIKRAIK